MANYYEQIVRAWEEWESETSNASGNPDDFIQWAIRRGRLAPRPQDLNKLMRKSVTAALRQVVRIDEEGTAYRAKQCVVLLEGGAQTSFWFDVDTGGTSNLRKKAVRQRRDAIANNVYRAMCDVEHMNFKHNENIQFVLDFTDDYEERKAAELICNDEEVA